MAMVLLFGVSAQATMAYLTVKTEPVKNTFVPVHSPVHDLDITVTGEKDVVEYVEKDGKQVAKPAWKEGDAFNFEVQVWEGNRWETVGTAAVAYDKDKDDFNKFDVSEIIKNQIAEPGEYSFRIAETKGSDSTITYDETACRFDVVVKADDTGAMDITEVKDIEDAKIVKDSESGDYTVSAAFTNKYTAPVIPPEPVDPDPIKIEFIVDKTVKNIGEEEIGPKGFDFKLVKDSTKEEWTEEADENGYAAFEMTYTKDDIGKTYLYELSEVNDGVEGDLIEIIKMDSMNNDNHYFADVNFEGTYKFKVYDKQKILVYEGSNYTSTGDLISRFYYGVNTTIDGTNKLKQVELNKMV